MWKNSTSSIPFLVPLFIGLTVGTSSIVVANNIPEYSMAVYRNCIRAVRGNELFGGISYTQSANVRLSEALKKNINKITLISTLKNNWNGNGASSFNPALIQKVSSIVLMLLRQPEIFPTSANTIQLEYEGPENSYLEIEISESDQAEVFSINKDGSEKSFSINDNIDSLNSLVNSFYE